MFSWDGSIRSSVGKCSLFVPVILRRWKVVGHTREVLGVHLIELGLLHILHHNPSEFHLGIGTESSSDFFVDFDPFDLNNVKGKTSESQ